MGGGQSLDWLLIFVCGLFVQMSTCSRVFFVVVFLNEALFVRESSVNGQFGLIRSKA